MRFWKPPKGVESPPVATSDEGRVSQPVGPYTYTVEGSPVDEADVQRFVDAGMRVSSSPSDEIPWIEIDETEYRTELDLPPVPKDRPASAGKKPEKEGLK